jgi:hypothetical protein
MSAADHVFAVLSCEFRGIVCKTHRTGFNVDRYRERVVAEAIKQNLPLHYRTNAVKTRRAGNLWETRFAVTWTIGDRRRAYSVAGLSAQDDLDLSAGGSPSDRSVLLEILYETQGTYNGDLDYWLEDGSENDILSEIIRIAQQHEAWAT